MRILITGTSQGIGLATAIKFLEHGGTVIGIDTQQPPTQLRDCKNYHHYIADVRCRTRLPVVGPIDILINNAGVQDEATNIDVNLMGVVNCCNKYGFHPSIKSVVNVASVSAHNGAEYPLYTASKGGVVAYTKWLAQELCQYGATVNSISPGGVITPMTEDIWNDEQKRKAVLDETLLNKWATAEEIADWIFFLSVINKSMTAQDIIIDNGETAKFNFIQ